MRINIVTKEPFPNGMAATNRIKCYARAIHEGGLDCEVIVIGGTEIKSGSVRNTNATGYYEGVHYRYIGGSPVLPLNKQLRLIIQSIRLLLTLLYIEWNIKKGDILFLYMSGKDSLVQKFQGIAKRKGAFCVLDLCELPYVAVSDPEKAEKLRKFFFENLFPKFDGIICISNNLLELAKLYTSSSCKCIKVPILVEFDKFSVGHKKVNYRSPFIFHAGTLYQQKDGILGMIEAFGMAKQKLNKPLNYILTGNVNESSHPAELKTLILKYQLEDSLRFVGYLNSEQIKDYLTQASLVISNRPKSQQDYYGFSTKVGEYLASGTPLLITNWGEAVNWLENGKSAYIVEPENTEALADAIVDIFTHSEDSLKIGVAGQEVCRQCFDYSSWIEPLVGYFEAVVNQ